MFVSDYLFDSIKNICHIKLSLQNIYFRDNICYIKKKKLN